MKKAVFGGRFNPMSVGQMDVIRNASLLYDELIVLVHNYELRNEVVDLATRAKLVEKVIKDKNLTNVIFAGVHQDVIPFLKPDWIYNTDERTLTINKDKYNMTVKDNKPYFMKIEG